MNLITLAKRYHAHESIDKSDFQRKARILQSIWRTEQGYEMGSTGDRLLGSRLPMPWAEITLANFLTPVIREVVEKEITANRECKTKLYEEERLFSNLLSSQPLCFNLFGELSKNLQLASELFKIISNGRLISVNSIEFEYSPGRLNPKYTNDKSAFDVFVKGVSLAGTKAFVGIEVKYHEMLNDDLAEHRERYDDLASSMECFLPECRERLKKKPLQQIWRDHLMAGAILQNDDYEDGFFAFLYPAENEYCQNAVKTYEACLSKTETFVCWTLEHIYKTLSFISDEEWVQLFYNRYLAFEKTNA